MTADKPAAPLNGYRFFDQLLPGGGKLFGALLLSWLLLCGVAGAGARGVAEWELTADRLTHLEETADEPRRIIAEGEVVLSRPAELGEPLEIRADWLSYYPELELVEARGRVRIQTPNERSEAESALLSLADATATLTTATIFLADSQLYIKGSVIKKSGEATYQLEDAWLSACHPSDDCPPAWSLTSRRAKVTLEGMAHLYHTSFRVRERAVAYTPYLLLPAKTKRQSGFLFPEWSHSERDGLGVNLPYFLNLSPSADLTLHPRYLAHRGLLAGAEFRYAAAPQSHGLLVASFLQDRARDSDRDDFKGDNLLRTSTNRYWLRGKADHDFGDDLKGKIDLDLVSDQDFIQEFDAGSLGYGALSRDFERKFGRDLLEPSLTTRQSRFQLSKTRATTLLAGELHLQQDSRHRRVLLPGHNADGVLASSEFIQRDLGDTPLQALPRLSLSGRTPLATRLSSLAWQSEYVHYWRSRGVGAHRLDLHPQLITPLPRAGGWLEGRATTGVRQTLYQITEHGAGSHPFGTGYQDRSAFDLEANLATTLLRDFALADSRRLEHLLRPNLIYTYQNRSSQRRLPELDAVDHLDRKNWLTMELNNYFELAESGVGGDYSSRPLAFFQLAQSYNLRDSWRENLAPGDRGRELSDLRLELQATPWPNFNLRYRSNLSVYGLGITRYELQGGYRPARGGSFSLNYRYLKHSGMVEPFFYTTAGDAMHDIVASFDTPLAASFSLYGLLNQSLSENHIAEVSLGLRYQPHCWAVDLELRRYIDETSVMVIFTLDTIGRFLRAHKGGI